MAGVGRMTVLALAAALIAACAQPPATDPFDGTYIVKGGGAPLPVFNALTAEFTKRHPGVSFAFEDVGSAAGIQLVASGQIDLATSSVEPKSELRDRVELVPIGLSGTAVVVPAANPVTALTREQVRMIFSGEINDWSALTPDLSGRILVGVRPPGSAIRRSFETYAFGSATPTYAKDALQLADTNETIRTLTSNRAVIAIITIDDAMLADSRIRLLTLDGVHPSKETLASAAWPMRRPLYLVAGQANLPAGILGFLDFVRSPDGQKIIAAAQPGA